MRRWSREHGTVGQCSVSRALSRSWRTSRTRRMKMTVWLRDVIAAVIAMQEAAQRDAGRDVQPCLQLRLPLAHAGTRGVAPGPRLQPIEVAVGRGDVVTGNGVPEALQVCPGSAVIARGGHRLEAGRRRQTCAACGLDGVDVHFLPPVAAQIVLQGRAQGIGHAVQLLLVLLKELEARLDQLLVALVLAALQLRVHELFKRLISAMALTPRHTLQHTKSGPGKIGVCDLTCAHPFFSP